MTSEMRPNEGGERKPGGNATQRRPCLTETLFGRNDLAERVFWRRRDLGEEGCLTKRDEPEGFEVRAV
jgi:hypothetical protein